MNNNSNNNESGVTRTTLKICAVLLTIAVVYGGYGPTLWGWTVSTTLWTFAIVDVLARITGYVIFALLACVAVYVFTDIISNTDVEWIPFWRNRHKDKNYQNVARSSEYLPRSESFVPPSNSFEPASDSFEPASDSFEPPPNSLVPAAPARAPSNNAVRPSLNANPYQETCAQTGNVTHRYPDGTAIVFDSAGNLLSFG